MAKKAVCALTRDEISAVVLARLRKVHKQENISEQTRFDIDLIADPPFKELYFFAIKPDIEAAGCCIDTDVFNEKVCRKAKTVKSIVDAAFKSLVACD